MTIDLDALIAKAQAELHAPYPSEEYEDAANPSTVLALAVAVKAAQAYMDVPVGNWNEAARIHDLAAALALFTAGKETS